MGHFKKASIIFLALILSLNLNLIFRDKVFAFDNMYKIVLVTSTSNLWQDVSNSHVSYWNNNTTIIKPTSTELNAFFRRAATQNRYVYSVVLGNKYLTYCSSKKELRFDNTSCYNVDGTPIDIEVQQYNYNVLNSKSNLMSSIAVSNIITTGKKIDITPVNLNKIVLVTSTSNLWQDVSNSHVSYWNNNTTIIKPTNTELNTFFQRAATQNRYVYSVVLGNKYLTYYSSKKELRFDNTSCYNIDGTSVDIEVQQYNYNILNSKSNLMSSIAVSDIITTGKKINVVPTAPTLLDVTCSSNSILLHLKSSISTSVESYYEIKRSINKGGPYISIGRIYNTKKIINYETFVLDNLNLEKGKTYYYVANSVLDGVSSSNSNEVYGSLTP